MKVVLLAALFSLTIYGVMLPTSASCGKVSGTVQSRIVGGQNADIENYPWAAHLICKTSKGENECGATLISNKALATAAHCVLHLEDDSTCTATLGVADLKHLGPERRDLTIPRENIRVPHDIHGPPYGNDVAVLELVRPLALTKYINPIRIPSNLKLSFPPLGSQLTVVGWGLTENGKNSRFLKYAKVKSISNCQALGILTNLGISDKDFRIVKEELTDEKFLIGYAKKKGVCVGDSGGGIIYYDGDTAYLAGVISLDVGRVCQDIKKPSVIFSTRVARFCSYYPKFCPQDTPTLA